MQAIKTGTFKSDVDRAIAFYYLIRNSFGSSVFSGWAFGPGRPPKYCSGIEMLDDARARLRSVYIDNLSFEKVIGNWDRKETLFYCDPPYYMLLGLKGRGYYQCAFTAEDHKRLRDILKGICGKVILSYDDHPEIRKLYKRFNVRSAGTVNYTINHRSGVPSRHRPEVIITNF